MKCICLEPTSVNSLAPGRPGCDFKTAIFNLVLLIGIFTSSNDNALRWMPWDLTDDKSTLVQVMAWCRQATSHYLSQCWPSSMSPYGVTRPQWVNPDLWCHTASLSLRLTRHFHSHLAKPYWHLPAIMAAASLSLRLPRLFHSLLARPYWH